jgi:N-acetylglucosamine kinase-like BadF-type ATPase
VAKKRKWPRKKSVFADVPIGETSWYEWRIELLLLAEMAVRKDGVDQATSLFDSIEKRTGRQPRAATYVSKNTSIAAGDVARPRPAAREIN